MASAEQVCPPASTWWQWRMTAPSSACLTERLELLPLWAGHRDFHCPEPVSLVALEHHERMNGSGYPSGCKGDVLHPYSRIAAVANAFDSLTADRTFRRGLPAREDTGGSRPLNPIRSPTRCGGGARCVHALHHRGCVGIRPFAAGLLGDPDVLPGRHAQLG